MKMVPPVDAQASTSALYQLTKVENKMLDTTNLINVVNIEDGCCVRDNEDNVCHHDDTPYYGQCPGIDMCPYPVNKSSMGPL